MVIRGKPFKKGNISWNKDKQLSLEHRKKLSKAKIGLPPEKHSCWKGNKAGYFALHLRVSKIRGNPKKCEECGSIKKNKKYEWANMTGDYDNVMDYKRMCQSCHRISHLKKKGYRVYASKKKAI